MKRFVRITGLSLLTACIVGGVLVRSIETVTGNYVFGFDQGLDFMAARNIAVNHKLTLIGSEAGAGFAGLPGIFHGPGYHYILAVLLWISNGNPYGAILFLYVLSLCSLWFLFRLCEAVFGRKTAFVIVALLALSPPVTAQARMIWAPNFSGLLVVPFLFGLWESRKRTGWPISLTSFIAASLYHFEIPMAVPAVLGLFLHFWFVLRIRGIRLWVFAFGGVIAGFSPMILFESRHGWGIVNGLFTYGNRVSEHSAQAPFYVWKELAGDWNAVLSTIRESLPAPMLFVRSVFPWVFLAVTAWITRKEKRKDVQNFVLGLFVLITAHFFVFYPYRGPVYSHYLTLLYSVYPILMGYGAYALARDRKTAVIAYAFGIMIIGGALSLYPRMVRMDFVDYGGTAKIRGKTNALDVIYKDASGEEFGLFVFTPPVVPYAYQYLALWYGGKKYGYVPEFGSKPVSYLLIEPDPEKPWSYNGWLETVMTSGKTIASWKLSSGFLIQKREMPQ